MAWLWLSLVAGAAYLVGSVPFGFLVARSRGIDIFKQGSGNIGATNVGRVLGRRLGLLVFFLDFLKGALPVAAALAAAAVVGSKAEPALEPEAFGVAAGLAAFLGHLYPIYLHFRGGKGVATGAGVFAVLLPGPALVALVAWVGVVCATRYVSLASLSAVAALCILQLWTREPFIGPNLIITLFCLAAAALVALRHRGNLVRLVQGTENRIPDSPKMFTVTKSIHVLTLGLWFGTLVFFTVMASSLFDTFEKEGQKTQDARPVWFPLPDIFNWSDPDINGPKEQGTRAAGAAVGPVFGKYFLIQGICGFLAVATALSWSQFQPGSRLARVRVIVLIAALMMVVIGWPVEQYVEDLRMPRDEATVELLRSKGADTALKEKALQARKEFVLWHLASLGLGFVTLFLVGAALALAGQLPERHSSLAATSPDAGNGAKGPAPLSPS